MPTRRTSKEEEDDNIDEEEDCAAAAAAAATAAATAVATIGCHASSAATASNQTVAAVAAARRSGLRWVTIAAAATQQKAIVDPVFLCLLSECLLHVAQNTSGSFPPEFRPRIPFPEQINLPWNDLIPTFVQWNRRNSTEFADSKNEASQEPEFKTECTS